MIAFAAMMLGLALWVRDSFTRGAVSENHSQISTSLAPAGSPTVSDVRSSALFRLGFSFTGGFFIGWLFRKSLKLALLAAGAMALVIAAGRHFHVFDLDWKALESQAAQSVGWIKGGLRTVKDHLVGYLPSAIAGFLGMFKGARHR
jgi:uncharacterized membrane protein (Fun14 family)